MSADTYEALVSKLNEKSVKLVAVSKTKPVAAIQLLYQKGQRIFGENKVQELTEKAPQLPDDIQWHLIGHLQRNKVKYITPFVAMIHSVDSLKLLKEIDKQAAKADRVIPCLLQMHIAEEDTKFGLNRQELVELLESEAYRNMHNIQVCGLMGMATFTDDENQVKREFEGLRRMFDEVKGKYFDDKPEFCELSMGMSGDYELAIAAGSTMVRIGSLLFGERNYT